jgi:putative hydrolase of the HAD superfamily
MALVLLDMGGVLIELDWQRQVGALLGGEFSGDQIQSLWVSSACIHDFECGRIDFEVFCQRFADEMPTTADAAEVGQRFMAIIKDPFPGCNEALRQIKDMGHHLGMLSNSNQAHEQALRSRWDFFSYFDDLFFSHHRGVMKPDPQAWTSVLAETGFSADNTWFFDDGRRNVEAAQELGIRAHQVFKIHEAVHILSGVA